MSTNDVASQQDQQNSLKWPTQMPTACAKKKLGLSCAKFGTD